jgi:hypothetical protein
VSPFIRFEQTKKLHRQAVIVDRMAKGFDGKPLFKDFSFRSKPASAWRSSARTVSARHPAAHLVNELTRMPVDQMD